MCDLRNRLYVTVGTYQAGSGKDEDDDGPGVHIEKRLKSKDIERE